MSEEALNRSIGSTLVSSIGLGCAALSLEYADDPPRGAAVINAALDAGISLIDTAAAYTPAGVENHNEELVRRVLSARPASHPRPFIATKGGHFRDGDAFPIDGRREALRQHCEGSLRALGVERIDLSVLHWPDPTVPMEESIGALDELRREGKIASIGVSNVDLPGLAAAQRVTEITAVENRLSLFDWQGSDVLRHCAATGIAYLAHSPLRGLSRASQELVTCIERITGAHRASPAQVALSWLKAQSPVLIPIVGASRVSTVRDAAAAQALTLTTRECADLEATLVSR